MEIVYLLICIAPLPELEMPDVCMVYSMRPQYVMTQPEIDGKVGLICDFARVGAMRHGDRMTRCEVVEKIPKGLTIYNPGIEGIKT